MPNTILKRWNGSSFEELYPKTTVGQISASGTASASTFLRGDGQWATPAGGGTVTSVTGTSPIASSGGNTPAISLAASYGDTQNPYASKTANFVLAAPNGTAGVPTFRAVVASDIPTLNQNTTGSAATLTTARTFTFGSTGKTFNGSANVSWTLSEIGAAPISHADAATTYGVGTNANYGHIKGVRLTGATDGESGVSVSSGIAYATKTLRVNGIAQQAWGTLLDLDTTESNILRFVNLTITRTEGSITYYIGSITVDVNGLATNNFTTTPSPTVTNGTRWRLNSRNSSNTQLTLPIYMFRNTVDNALRVYVDNATSATYDYECVGYF